MADELDKSTARVAKAAEAEGAAKAANATKTAAGKQNASQAVAAKPAATAGAAKPAAKKKAARAVPKSALTKRYDALKERVWTSAARVRAAFFGDSWAGGAMWFAAVLAMIAVLLWFFFFSDFGTPAEPIYEGF